MFLQISAKIIQTKFPSIKYTDKVAVFNEFAEALKVKIDEPPFPNSLPINIEAFTHKPEPCSRNSPALPVPCLTMNNAAS